MSAERKVGCVEKNFRGLLAASMLFFAPDAGPAPSVSGGSVKRAEAAGLVQPQEQEIDWEEWDKVVAQVATPIETKDIVSIRKLLSTDGFLDWTYNLQPSPRSKSIDETTNLFKKSFETRGAPSCVGYKWEMAVIAVLFDNLGVINSSDGSGHAIVYLSINAQKVPRISFVSEVPKDKLEWEKRTIGVVDVPQGAKVKVSDEIVLRPCGKAAAPRTPSRQHIFWIPGMLTFIDETGIEANGRFSPARDRLTQPDFAYRFNDYTVVGYTGGYIDNRGNYIGKRQNCEETLQSIDVSGQNVAEAIVGWLKAHPNETLAVVGHSLGGPVILRALEIIKEKNPTIDMKRVKIITTHSPNQGINKSPLDILAKILPGELPSDCYIDVGPVPIPSPRVVDYSAVSELLAMWDKRGETQARWGKVTAWLKDQGGQVFALANYYDCVIALEMCASKVVGRWPWDLILPWWLSWVEDPYFYATLPSVLWSQEIPGATNIWRSLGNDPNWGHTKYLDEGEGLETLAAVIGKQNK